MNLGYHIDKQQPSKESPPSILEYMGLRFRHAELIDASLLISIYDAVFYQDYLRYGKCLGCGKTLEVMERSIAKYPKFIIYCGNQPVGCISCHASEPELSSLQKRTMQTGNPSH